jgi:hypothetical protein
MPIPPFLENGLLPEGLHMSDLAEVEERFGRSSARRRELFERLILFMDLARHCGAIKILIDGSFVTAKPEPGDVDVVIRLGQTHEDLIVKQDATALELEIMFESREPKKPSQLIMKIAGGLGKVLFKSQRQHHFTQRPCGDKV